MEGRWPTVSRGWSSFAFGANETTLKIRRRTGSSNALTVQFSWIECYKSRQRPNVALDAAGCQK
ncbi:hypothetical protein T02_14360 [Trichinella nativa]|uniref:Uncharacterized protein n=3 Tax=Trichinella TaxID=6333 RepID=A0A0V1LE27_9BILA|nr:hypothetical protein T05_3031 [Trichinella murrelli]KRX76731.1 hypothetical protein T06_6047 [Trichinella sp. T6]KRY23176.1 hypothetical protein T12_1787 [Trichinella patagoniensis]KRZ57733.1 hypothetical protein T02_14360 [Trichinella nativa]